VEADTRLVFLHIPKTAGQAVHGAIARVIGEQAISPVRVHSQAGPGVAQMPPGFRLYSGHLDWEALDTLPRPRFVFTVLRDPLERIASFYFFLRHQARGLSAEDLAQPARTGMRMVSTLSADEYFCGGDRAWQTFIRDHDDTVYCTYFATRRIRGWRQVAELDAPALIDRALAGAAAIDAIYSVEGLDRLEDDLERWLGTRPQIVGRVVNAGPRAETGRWPDLRALLQSEESVARLESFAERDRELMRRLPLDGAL